MPTKRAKGWATYRWSGLDGDEATLELRTSEHPDHTDADDKATAALNRATTDPRAAVELAAVLARLVELNDVDGQWRWARVTELLHGTRAKTDRHNPLVQGWLALLERARWHLAPRVGPGRDGRMSKAGPPLVDGRAIVSLERHTRCSATVRLLPAVAHQLASECLDTAHSTLELVAPPNPEGNNPSRPVRGRARLAAIFATAVGAGDFEVEDLMARYGGIDLAPVTSRRHIPGWTDHVIEELAAGLRAIGKQLAQVPQRARRALSTVVRFATSALSPTSATPPPPPARGAPPSSAAGAATPGRPRTARSSRAP